MDQRLDFLKSDLAEVSFGFHGQLGDASKAVVPILQALEATDTSLLPCRISSSFRKQMEAEISQLQQAGLRRVIRITAPQFLSAQGRGGLGFTRWVDASREWRECEISAAVLDRYVDSQTGQCVIERYDQNAVLTLRQSRHIRASDQRKAKNSKQDVYTREQYTCPSCGAQLTQSADNTCCPYCGATITFHFFDWQLDSFYLDLHKDCLMEGVKDAAAKVGFGLFQVVGKLVALLADSMQSRDADNPNMAGFDYTLSAILTVLILFALGFLALPWYVQAALGGIVVALVVRGILRYRRSTEQNRKKAQIVRYSDAYLRSCVYDELWKCAEIDGLIDFSVDSIKLKSVEHTEQTTTIRVVATAIRKVLLPERRIDVITEDVPMRLCRARYPERKKSKGRTMEEKDCPNCGANFSPDENHCCSYCGYGLKLENYVWRRVD